MFSSVVTLTLAASWPFVDWVNGCTWAKNGLALSGQVWNEGELMTVELEYLAEDLLFVPLAMEAVRDILNIEVKNIDLGLVEKRFLWVLGDCLLVLHDLVIVRLLELLSFGDSLRQGKYFESQSLNSNDLIGVDINWLLVGVLVNKGLSQAILINCFLIIGRHDGTISWFLLNSGFGTCFCTNFGSSSSFSMSRYLRSGFGGNLGCGSSFCLSISLNLWGGLNISLSCCHGLNSGVSF